MVTRIEILKWAFLPVCFFYYVENDDCMVFFNLILFLAAVKSSFRSNGAQCLLEKFDVFFSIIM